MTSSWPELRIGAWRDTYATLHLYTQVVGKIRMALAPKMNQWWNVPLYLTTRGLTTSPMPYQDRTLAIDFDFIDHQLLVTDSDGHVRRLPLVPRPVCDFYDALFEELAAIDVRVQIHPLRFLAGGSMAGAHRCPLLFLHAPRAGWPGEPAGSSRCRVLQR